MQARDESYLLTWFRAFYAEVVYVKQTLLADVPAPLPEAARPGRTVVTAAGTLEVEGEALPGPGGDDPLRARVMEIRHRLLALLERQEKAAEQIGGAYAFELYREAQYAMAALADEILLHTPWAGRDLWQDHLLETRLFGTAVAGERLFERMDQVLHAREAGFVELAKIYFLALVLGFEGGCRGRSTQRLLHYRQQLFAFITSHEGAGAASSAMVLPQAYDHTLVEGEATLLPDPRRWAWVLVLVVLTMLILSTAIWQNLTHEMAHVLTLIPDHRP